MTEHKKLLEEALKKDSNYYRTRYREWEDSLRAELDSANSKLYDFIQELEDEYFADIQCQEGSLASDYLRGQEIDDDGEPYDYYPYELVDNLSIFRSFFRFYVEDLEKGTMGEIDFSERTLKISPAYANDKAVVLHEMMHVYEFVLGQVFQI